MIIFYRISNYYLNISSSITELSPSFLSKQEASKLTSNQTLSNDELKKIISIIGQESSSYKVSKGERYIAFIPWAVYKIKLFVWGRYQTEIESEIQKFRANQKEKLLNNITSSCATLHQYLQYLNEYVFCDGFSLWSFNEQTNIFICEASTNKKFEALPPKSAPSLVKALDDDSICIYKNLENSNEMYEYLASAGVKSVNRFTISIKERFESRLVVSFYSKQADFFINDEIARMLKGFVKSKYLELIESEGNKIDSLSLSTLPSIADDNLNTYLTEYCKAISDIFNFQDCTVFGVNDNTDVHVIASNTDTLIVDEKLHTMITQSYQKAEQYCLYKKEAKSKELSSTNNIIMIPIIVAANKFGVLAVRNKYRVIDNYTEFIPPKLVHFYSVLRANIILSQVIDMFSKYSDVARKLEEQNNFNRVLMHEIRTPISKFTMAPEIIKKRISQIDMDDFVKDRILLQLDDIQTLGGRLKFLTDSYQLEEMIRVKNFSKIKLIKDLILPVLSVTKPYANKQYNCDLWFDDKDMQGVEILGDVNLMQMALHALLDNAAKYSLTKSSSVKIYIDNDGINSERFVGLSVSNIGYSISFEEINSIFENGYRGESVNKENIDGTGIGLFLVKEIMEVSNGDVSLKLIPDSSEIIFTLKLPLFKEML